jgi:hypothetical protein
LLSSPENIATEPKDMYCDQNDVIMQIIKL